MNISEEVQKAATKKGIGGVMTMTPHCGLSYERTRKVWEGQEGVKFADVEQVFNSLGCDIVIVEQLGTDKGGKS